jgi:2-methylcitrate dehydratase PrpD
MTMTGGPAATDWSFGVAAFLAEHRVGAAAIRDRTELILADTIGALIAGTREPETVALLARSADGTDAGVLGTRRCFDMRRAALINGIAGTASEMDEGNYACGGHPAVHCIAAALPYAEALDVSGGELVEAVAVAYEASARIGAATTLRDAAHSHGTWGTIGAATAVARLQKFGAEQMWHVLQAAATLCLATSRTSGLVGATIRNAYAGVAAMNGIIACELVQAGFRGEPRAVETIFGSVVGEAFDSTGILDELGSDWLLADGFLKPYASCRETHGAIDAFALAVRRSDRPAPAPEAIAAITVETFAQAARLDEAAPANPLAARYSLPFALATRIVRGCAGVAEFHDAAVHDPRIRDLAARIAVRSSAALTARLPAERVTRLEIVLTSGRILSAETAASLGDSASPLSADQLMHKFHALVEPSFGPASQEMFRAWRNVDRAPSIAALCTEAWHHAVARGARR